VSIKGLNNLGYNGFDYPYKAISPVTGKKKLFESIEDVYSELVICYEELEEKQVVNKSENLYLEHFFFCNTSELLDRSIQRRLKEYNYCKTFSTAPYRSLTETPAKVVDDFLEIEYIMNSIKKDKNG
tara:strand:+ start:5433 stop:5813 length:381 start_codon:yes stop_codon:yes gene_type:complete